MVQNNGNPFPPSAKRLFMYAQNIPVRTLKIFLSGTGLIITELNKQMRFFAAAIFLSDIAFFSSVKMSFIFFKQTHFFQRFDRKALISAIGGIGIPVL